MALNLKVHLYKNLCAGMTRIVIDFSIIEASRFSLLPLSQYLLSMSMTYSYLFVERAGPKSALLEHHSIFVAAHIRKAKVNARYCLDRLGIAWG